jgi:hypothetical protein
VSSLEKAWSEARRAPQRDIVAAQDFGEPETA